MYETLQDLATEDIMASLYPQVRMDGGGIEYLLSISLDGLDLPRLRIALTTAENGDYDGSVEGGRLELRHRT
jgi:hypothetical protein